jgi:hypothetical protein
MKFLRHDGEKFQLEFEREEKAFLFHLLSLYPLVPESHHRLTKDKKLPRRAENQQLLDEALKSQREQNRKEIVTLVNEPGRFAEASNAFRVGFTRGEMEWLLQVVNDVRVGCWIALGSPGYATKKKAKASPDEMRHMMFMEIGGAFEMFFLGIMNGDVPPQGAK